MSFDLPANVARDLEEYAQAESISPAEAALKFIQTGLKASKRRTRHADLVTDEQLNQLRIVGLSGLLDDVPEENIKRMELTIRQMKREGFRASA